MSETKTRAQPKPEMQMWTCTHRPAATAAKRCGREQNICDDLPRDPSQRNDGGNIPRCVASVVLLNTALSICHTVTPTDTAITIRRHTENTNTYNIALLTIVLITRVRDWFIN